MNSLIFVSFNKGYMLPVIGYWGNMVSLKFLNL